MITMTPHHRPGDAVHVLLVLIRLEDLVEAAKLTEGELLGPALTTGGTLILTLDLVLAAAQQD